MPFIVLSVPVYNPFLRIVDISARDSKAKDSIGYMYFARPGFIKKLYRVGQKITKTTFILSPVRISSEDGICSIATAGLSPTVPIILILP